MLFTTDCGCKHMEAESGIEPEFTDLQSVASPLCHDAIDQPSITQLLHRQVAHSGSGIDFKRCPVDVNLAQDHLHTVTKF